MFFYQWWFTNQSGSATKLTDGGVISGSISNVLTLSSVASGNAGTYVVVLTNGAGAVTSSSAVLSILTPGPATLITMSAVETAGQDWNTGTIWSDGNPASLSAYSEPGSTYEVLSSALLRTPASALNTAFPGNRLVITNGGELLLEHSGAISIAFQDLQLNGALMDNGADGLVTLTGEVNIANNVTIYTDTNAPPGLVINFDVAGGIGGVNYAGYGAFEDVTGHTNWNPIAQTSGTGTTSAPSIASDGVTPSQITLTIDSGGFAEGNQYAPYGTYDNSKGAPANAPEALESDYLYLGNTFTPNAATNTITNTLDNVPAGTYNLYLYGNDGARAGGFVGEQNDWGTTFAVTSDGTLLTILRTANAKASLTSDSFVQGTDYVVFSNVVVGASGTITFTWTPNTAVSDPADYAGPNSQAAFNGLQLVAVVPPPNGPRSVEIDSLLTGTGTIEYDAGDTNYLSDLRITGAANTFSGQWNIQQGTVLGSGANSLGTNVVTVGANGALETTYNINDTGASLTLNGQMFLHQNDTFQTITVNGVNMSPGTYSFTQLNKDFPGNFPMTWPLQTGSAVNSGSGNMTVLAGPAGSAKAASIVTASLLGGSLAISGTNGTASDTYQVLTSTNLALSVTNWVVMTNGSFDANGNFNVSVPFTSSDKQRFYSIVSP